MQATSSPIRLLDAQPSFPHLCPLCVHPNAQLQSPYPMSISKRKILWQSQARIYSGLPWLCTMVLKAQSRSNNTVLTMTPVPRGQAAAAKPHEENFRASTTSQNQENRVAQAETKEDDAFQNTMTGDTSTRDWITDSQNPMHWSPLRKWMIVWLLVITNLIA